MMATLDKSTVLEALRERGLHARADWADRVLPDLIDVSSNAGLLATLGLDPQELPTSADEAT